MDPELPSNQFLKLTLVILGFGAAGLLAWLSEPSEADHLARGLAFEALHRSSEADKELLQAGDLGQYPEAIRYKIGKIYFRGTDYKAAENIFRSILKEDPANTGARYYLWRTYLKWKKYDEAAKILPPLVQNPQTARQWEIAGDSKRIEDQKAAALVDYEKALTMKPKESRLLFKIGMLYFKMDRLAEARANFEKGALLKENEGRFWLKLIQVLERQGDEAAYFQRIQEIYEKNPFFDNVYTRIGELYRKHGFYRAAIRHYQDFLERYPKTAGADFFLGLAYLESGRPQKAREQFLKVMSYGPNVVAAQYYSGLASMGLGELDNAYTSIKTAKDKGYPDVPEELLRNLEKTLHIYA